MYTGLPIKIHAHYFDLKSSHERNHSNFNTTYIYYCMGLSFDAYNFFLGQLVQKWQIVKSLNYKKESLEKIRFTNFTGYNLNFLIIFGLATALFLTATPTWVSFGSCKSKRSKKNQITACDPGKMHLFQTFLFVVPTLMTHHF